ncbi:MAG: thioredoxin domain-containing protein [Methanomicrobiales archaeon]|nr:thioredoxin domain-containing protein [Methanomicrobiales archaeon]
MSEPPPPVNRLIREQSPYLLQHAHNPVDWYPWIPEAFERAAREDKPIFLSIGYSTCHWCHVMAHESFEDAEVAGLLNAGFISIKVDREERPDIDQVYMAVCQAMTGQGGWPLTIVMTPNRKPFFAATYLPRHTEGGMPGLLDLLPRLTEAWKTGREDIEKFTADLIGAMQTEEQSVPSANPSPHLLDRAYRALDREFDPQNGGFGVSPKFPSPHQLLFLLRIWYRIRDPHALEMVEKTLQELRKGGIFDHIGYGFHRYAVDRQWIVPHFEKMLYDQALLAIAYLEAHQVTGDPRYARVAREIFTYVLRDLRVENGGFYAGEDADSEGVEGKYYVWTWRELEEALEPDDLAIFSQTYNLKKEGNIPLPVHGVPVRANILHLQRPEEDIAREARISIEELHRKTEHVRKILERIRSTRVRPRRDTKILADWNGLMIAALAFGGRVLDEPEYTRAAQRAAATILGTMQRASGRLNHVYRTEERYIDAFSADYAAMAWGAIELYETTFDLLYLDTATGLMLRLAEWYRDPINGGYFFTPSDGESLLVRKKEAFDGALPSANSIAIYNWLRLAPLTGKGEFEERGRGDWRAFSGVVNAAPQEYTFLLIAADYSLGPSQQVVIAGNPASTDTQEMIRILATTFFPRLTVHLMPEAGSTVPLGDLVPFIQAYPPPEGKAKAYICMDHRCLPPVTGTRQLIERLTVSK